MSKPSKMQQRLAVPKHQRQALGSMPFTRQRTSARVLESVKTDEVIPKEGRRVVFMSRPCVKRYQFGPDDVLISITDPGDGVPELATTPAAVLHMAYMAYPTREDRKNGHEFDHARALQVATFLKLNTSKGNIIVHCSYGEQRSFAMAASLGDYFNLPVYTVSQSMKLLDKPKYSSAPLGDYAYHMFKALDQFYD